MASKLLLFSCVALQLWAQGRAEANPNTCVECARTPSACRRISGLYTVTTMTEGTYNPVVDIPAPACSINITEFRESRNYIGIKTKRNQGIINSYWGLGQPGQYYGAGARFSYERGSDTCKGTCLRSDGPTSEAIVVQILYYDKNPGISYEFILPNHIPFTPYQTALSKQSGPRPQIPRSGDEDQSASLPDTKVASTDTSSSSSSSDQRRHPRRFRIRQRPTRLEENDNGGEYYTGSQYSRSEGRPDFTSALEAPEVKEVSRHTKRFDYSGANYGTHNLGGQGQSYTSGRDTQLSELRSDSARSGRPGAPRRLPTTRDQPRIISRYRKPPVPGNPVRTPVRNVPVRKIAPPKYISNTRGSYSRGQYQSLTAQQTFDNTLDSGYDNVVRSFESNQISSITRPLSTNQGRHLSGGSYRWKISGFTECSTTCGGGVQTTNVICVSTGGRNVVVVTSENCQHSRRPRTQTVECNTETCDATWEAEKWSSCSVTCGSGTQTRTVECRQRFSPRLILRRSADQCGLDNKPAVAQQCEEGLCTEWRTGAWGQCSKECGGGQQTRNVYCMDQTSHQIPANYCTEATPHHSQPCHTHKCSSQWWLSGWSKECSESCGEGVQSRSALCMDDSGRVVSQRNCFGEDKPKLEERCTSGSACRGLWFTGPWGRCSSACGEGTRRRQVVCMQRDDRHMEIVHNDKCEVSLRPETQETCSNDDCNVNWYSSNWSECSATCGDGVRTRETRCVEDRRSSISCPSSLKPHTREVCSRTPCIDYQRTEIKYNERAERKRQRANRVRSTSAPEIKNSEETPEAETYTDSTHRNQWPIDSLKTEENEEKKEDVKEKEVENRIIISTHSYAREAPRDCRDSFYNCRMVAQSRLCSYRYYKKLCCQTCHKLKHSRH